MWIPSSTPTLLATNHPPASTSSNLLDPGHLDHLDHRHLNWNITASTISCFSITHRISHITILTSIPSLLSTAPASTIYPLINSVLYPPPSLSWSARSRGLSPTLPFIPMSPLHRR